MCDFKVEYTNQSLPQDLEAYNSMNRFSKIRTAVYIFVLSIQVLSTQTSRPLMVLLEPLRPRMRRFKFVLATGRKGPVKICVAGFLMPCHLSKTGYIQPLEANLAERIYFFQFLHQKPRKFQYAARQCSFSSFLADPAH